MLQVFARNLDEKMIAASIETAAQQRHASAKLPMKTLLSGRIQSPAGFTSNTAFIQALLDTLQDTAFVDISDFEIIERRQRWNRPLVAAKKGIWNLLRFYTFRLWSQQNEINGFLLAALQGIHEDANDRITKLEARIAALEANRHSPAHR